MSDNLRCRPADDNVTRLSDEVVCSDTIIMNEYHQQNTQNEQNEQTHVKKEKQSRKRRSARVDTNTSSLKIRIHRSATTGLTVSSPVDDMPIDSDCDEDDYRPYPHPYDVYVEETSAFGKYTKPKQKHT